jgi:tight adherence protein B
MWLTALLIFICTAWIAGLVLNRLMAPSLVAAERLSGYVQPVRRASTSAGAGRWSGIPSVERAMKHWNLGQALERLLDGADIPLKPFEFIQIVFLCGMLAGGLALVTTHDVLIVVPAAGLAAGVPLLWLLFKRSRRRDAFNRQLPDALQALAGALRVGLGLNQGMSMVADEQPYPISAEFRRAQREMNLGLSVDDALQNMAARMRSEDFDLAVAGILINRQVGGNLAELLDQVTATIRERFRLRSFIKVLTAQQRIGAIVILCVPPILMAILLLGLREYSSYLIDTTLGRVMLITSVFMQLLGMFAIRRIMAIEV